ncbi:MAG: UDP-N-acetylmuramate dehydrogenase [Actinomycetota bacterium]
MTATSSLDETAAALERSVRGKVRRDFPISRFTSFRLGGPAAVLVEPADAEDLAAVGRVLAKTELEPLVIGRGTNLLVSDDGYEGVVIRLGKPFEWIRSEDSELEAGGSTPLPQVANRAARLSLTGLEFAIAIPATVGGAVKMNAGAHSSSVSDILGSATICRLAGGELKTVNPEDLAMGYRESSLGASDVVTSARFRLESGDREEILGRMERYRTHRSTTQPVEAPNAGSMFRNPAGDTAGRLIEAAGLKGRRAGGAEVSQKHANFFLALPGARAQDVYELMALVQKAVKRESGVLLIPEVRLAGRFNRTAPLEGA